MRALAAGGGSVGKDESMSAIDSLSASYLEDRPKSSLYLQRASSALGGRVGHDLRHFEPVPLYIEAGRAGRKWDVDGNEYVDFLMGNGALLLGHAHPLVLDAIRRAVGGGTHFGNDHPPQIEWAEWVQELVPSAERVRFVNSGSEATVLAARLARAFTGRNKLLRFEGHFHGWLDDFVHGFQPPFDADGSAGVPPGVRKYLVTIPDGQLDLVEQVLARDNDIAAAILEPSGASWGRVPIAEKFLHGLREITRRHDVLLIFDEVVTGFRFSPGGAQELYGIRPDLSCFAKILAGGMPGGAVAGRADIMARFDRLGVPGFDRFETVTHLGTFNAAPLSAAAGVATLQQIATGKPIERANQMARMLRHSWDRVLERCGIAGYVYGPCSTFHVYFETDRRRVREAASRQSLRTSDAERLKGMPLQLISVYQRLLRHHGVDNMSSTGGIVSAVHTERDVEDSTRAFEKTVVALCEAGLIFAL